MLNKLNQPKIAWLAWVTFIITICTIITINGNKHTVTTAYKHSSAQWEQGKNIYNVNEQVLGTGFIYFPQSAIALIPLTYLPVPLSEILWRLLSIGLFAFAIYRFCSLGNRAPPQQYFLTTTLVSILLLLPGARNGQMTVIVSALMMLGCIDIYEKHWWRASLFLTLGLALKPIAIIWFLLAAAVYRPMLWRLSFCFIILWLFPFITQHPHYVIAQYRDMITVLAGVSSYGAIAPKMAHLFGVLNAWGIHVTEKWQTLCRLIAAFIVLLCCFIAKNKFTAKQVVFLFYGLAAGYYIVFGPSIENVDFCVFAGVLSLLIVDSFIAQNFISEIAFCSMTIIFTGSYYFSKLLIPGTKSWAGGLMGIILLLYIAANVIFSKRTCVKPIK